MIHSGLEIDDPPPGCLRMADLIAALSLAADLAIGLPAVFSYGSQHIGGSR
jgi:hypothetical protein